MRGENMRSGFLQQCDDLFALHARKTFKKLLDRISCFQMIEEALRRHPRARKHWLASKHLGILRNDAAHAANVKIKMNRKPAGCIRPFPSSFIRHTSYFRRLLQDSENAVLVPQARTFLTKNMQAFLFRSGSEEGVDTTKKGTIQW